MENPIRGGPKYCANCGAQIKANTKYCANCGARIKVNTKYCANCGAQVDANAEICPKCGVRRLPVPQPKATIVPVPQPMATIVPVSDDWYIAPLLFGIVGGIIGWAAIKDRDPQKATNMIIVGIISTIISTVIMWLIL